MSNPETPTGNPGVVGLAGFGLTTMITSFTMLAGVGLARLWPSRLFLVDWLKW
jgi:succinate-acetate transporter protein